MHVTYLQMAMRSYNITLQPCLAFPFMQELASDLSPPPSQQRHQHPRITAERARRALPPPQHGNCMPALGSRHESIEHFLQNEVTPHNRRPAGNHSTDGVYIYIIYPVTCVRVMSWCIKLLSYSPCHGERQVSESRLLRQPVQCPGGRLL